MVMVVMVCVVLVCVVLVFLQTGTALITTVYLSLTSRSRNNHKTSQSFSSLPSRDSRRPFVSQNCIIYASALASVLARRNTGFALSDAGMHIRVQEDAYLTAGGCKATQISGESNDGLGS